MKSFFRNAGPVTRIEFWIFITIFIFFLFFFFVDSFEGDQPPYKAASYYPLFRVAGMQFDFDRNYFLPQLIRHLGLFASLAGLNFFIVPGLEKRSSLLRSIILLLVIFGFLVLLYGITGTWLQSYLYGLVPREEANDEIFTKAFEHAWITVAVVAVYTGIKYACNYLLAFSKKIENKYNFFRKEAVFATVTWLAGMFILRFGRAEEEIIFGWAIVIPCAIALYLFSFYRLIPRSLQRSRYPFTSYFKKCLLLIFAVFFVMYIISIFITQDDDAGLGYSTFNAFFQLMVTVPVSWYLYKRFQKGNEEIQVLQKALNRSAANIDLLRSQINPHFLFNALNTLYGTAIQENADRTSEGIQKLGDMMRFMLQENMQDKISLTREIDYLENYISLQRLRTDPNPGIEIQIQIAEPENHFQVAPMLLIPFVENAFKHGISFREPSYIKATLVIKESTLYFDVSNSKHARPENDPEKDKSGIGLENVKQRLKLSYPGKHELLIRDTPAAFYVHLTLQLAKFA